MFENSVLVEPLPFLFCLEQPDAFVVSSLSTKEVVEKHEDWREWV